jgi:hypothetical protein
MSRPKRLERLEAALRLDDFVPLPDMSGFNAACEALRYTAIAEEEGRPYSNLTIPRPGSATTAAGPVASRSERSRCTAGT